MWRALIIPGLFLLSWPVVLGTVNRLLFVLDPPTGLGWVDQRYADHPGLTALHLAPGLLFFLLAPLQFSSHLRRNGWHKQIGRLLIGLTLVSGIGVLTMVLVFPALGGLLTQISTFGVVGCMCLFILVAWRAIRAKDIRRHRAFMIRAYALGLSVSTARIFIEAAALGGVTFEDSFVLASAIGVAVNLLGAEVIVRRG